MEQLKEFIMSGKAPDSVERVKNLLEQGSDPEEILTKAMIGAMDEVGDLFSKGEIFVPEMLISARALKQGMEVLKPILVESGVEPLGKIVLGTVKGDLHDIGKNILAIALEGAGFEIIDLGADVDPEKFVAAVNEHSPKLIGMSALITTTMPAMKDTIAAIDQAGLRNQVKIMVGGAPLNQKFADEIGADFFGNDSTAGRNYARKVVNS